MPTPPKPVEYMTKHMSKRAKTERATAEKSLLTGENFTESAQVKSDPVAHREYMRLKRLYEKIDFVDALDKDIINDYCMERANLEQLTNILIQMRNKCEETDDLDQKMTVFGELQKVSVEIRKCREVLLKMQDRLFLNPAGRLRAIPKKPAEPEQAPSGVAAFQKRRAQ